MISNLCDLKMHNHLTGQHQPILIMGGGEGGGERGAFSGPLFHHHSHHHKSMGIVDDHLQPIRYFSSRL